MFNKRVAVTGGAGFLGSFVCQKLRDLGAEVFVPLIEEYDLTRLDDIRRLYEAARPEIVIHLAAKVGGIGANRLNPGSFFYDNLMMGVQLLHQGYLRGIEKFVAVATICAYPKFAPTPFREDDLWKGYPEETNAPYGLAKKMLLVQSQAYRQQYGFNSVVLFPVNLYGPCFSPDTDVLTPTGIRNVSDIAVGDAVYSLNAATKQVEIATVVSLTRTMTREWFHFKGRAVDFVVTPDHTMFYRTSRGFMRRRAEWFRSRAGRASGQMVFAHHRAVAGASKPTINLEPYKDTDHVTATASVRDFIHSHSKRTPVEFRLLDFAEFVGWYVAEGCTRRKTTRSGNVAYQIAIAQQNTGHRRRIRALLRRMGFVFSENQREFHFNSRLVANYVRSEIGHGAGRKHLPRACFGWGFEARLRLLEAMMAGDGHANGRRYTSKSLQLVEDFCHLAFICGWKARISRFDGCYRVSIRKARPTPCVKYKDIRVREVSPEPALCFTLDRNHIVYAGRNRCFNWIGQCDNFDLESSHVIPAMIRKFVEARERGEDRVVLWGDGSPTREFLYVEDAAEGIVLAAQKYNESDAVNLGNGREIRIRDLAVMVARQCGFEGRVEWDASKPNGQPRRCLDTTRARERFGFVARTGFEEGLERTIAWYLSQQRQDGR